MSDQKESSVLFNLKELMNLEEDRIHSEAEAAQKAAEAERARIAAEVAARIEPRRSSGDVSDGKGLLTGPQVGTRGG